MVEPVGDRGGDLPCVGGVKNGKSEAGGGRNDLGCQRRPTHACKNDVVDAIGGKPRMQIT